MQTFEYGIDRFSLLFHQLWMVRDFITPDKGSIKRERRILQQAATCISWFNRRQLFAERRPKVVHFKQWLSVWSMMNETAVVFSPLPEHAVNEGLKREYWIEKLQWRYIVSQMAAPGSCSRMAGALVDVEVGSATVSFALSSSWH